METSIFSFKKSFKFASSEYVHWITNPKLIILSMLIVFIYEFDIRPLVDAAELMNVKLSILEPFVTIGSSGVIMMILPIMYLVIMAGYPRSQAGDWFYVIRLGRINWGVGQILFGVMTIITYVTFIALCTMVPVLWRADYNAQWSDVATKYTLMFPDKMGDFTSGLLPKNLYNQMPLGKAVIHTYLFFMLYLLLLLLVMLVLSLEGHRAAGFITACVIVAAGTALCSVKSPAMWVFPMAQSVVWLHFTQFFRKRIVELYESYMYFGVINAVLITLILQRMSKHRYLDVEV